MNGRASTPNSSAGVAATPFQGPVARRCAWPVAALAAALAIAGSALPARADLTLCNMTASRVGVSIGYKKSEEWVSEGWWNILSNSCETLFTGDLEGRYYYVHAIDYDRGGEWAGNATMCTAEKSFKIAGVADCGSKNFREARFFEIDTGEAKDYTIWLTDPSGKDAKTQ